MFRILHPLLSTWQQRSDMNGRNEAQQRRAADISHAPKHGSNQGSLLGLVRIDHFPKIRSRRYRVSNHTVMGIREREAKSIAERKKQLVSLLADVATVGAERMSEKIGKANPARPC